MTVEANISWFRAGRLKVRGEFLRFLPKAKSAGSVRPEASTSTGANPVAAALERAQELARGVRGHLWSGLDAGGEDSAQHRDAARARRREARRGARVDSAQSVDAQGRVRALRAEQLFLAEVWARVERLGGRLEDLSVANRGRLECLVEAIPAVVIHLYLRWEHR